MILIPTPNNATKNMSFPSISSGFFILSIASSTKKDVITQTNAIEINAPKVWALWNPKVYVMLADFLDINMTITLVKNPAISNILIIFF